jgi:diguanylate cyclase (GGDEF)-like protein
MALPLPTATTIDIQRTRQREVAVTAPKGSANPLIDTRFRLLNNLQTSLNIDAILHMFENELADLLNINGLRYVCEQHNVLMSHGRATSHTCNYRLITQKDHLGEITLYRDTRFSDQDLEAVETLLSVLLSPLRNGLQYLTAVNASMTDPLTGAGNRSALNAVLAREASLAKRYRQGLSVLIVDIDKFKNINDMYGHSTGDNVLQALVELINQINRSTDLCYRYGGEEFVVVLSKTGKSGALVIAERLRYAVANLRICSDEGPIQITVSIGVACFKIGDSEQNMLDRADKAMYRVKRSGGNRAAF